MSAQRTRGVTLIELMVTLVVASFVMIGISSAFIAMARNYQATASRRDVQASARTSVAFMEDRIRMAGYGVDPHLAVEAWDSFDPSNGSLAAGLDFPDAIAVHERDPVFQRTAVAAGGASIQVTPALKEDVERGQIFLLLCASAEKTAYVIAANRVAAGGDTIPLVNGGATLVGSASPVLMADNRFEESGKVAADPCFASASVVKIDRYAFYVASFDDDNSPNTPNVPFLMLHRGLDLNRDGTIDAQDGTPVADGVEQLQISYVMNARPPTIPPLLGVADGSRVPSLATWDVAAQRPLLASSQASSIATPDGNRFTNNPGNIRQIRVSVVTRSDFADPKIEGDTLFDNSSGASAWNQQTFSNGTVAWRQLENLANPANAAFNPVEGGYSRSVMRLSISTKNLMMARQFPPGAFGG